MLLTFSDSCIGKIPSFPVLWLISSAVLSAGLCQATLFGAVPVSFLLGTLVSSRASPEEVSLRRSFSFEALGFHPTHFTTDIFSAFVGVLNCKISMN